MRERDVRETIDKRDEGERGREERARAMRGNEMRARARGTSKLTHSTQTLSFSQMPCEIVTHFLCNVRNLAMSSVNHGVPG